MKKIFALALLLGLFALPAGAGAVTIHDVSEGKVTIEKCSGGCQGHVIKGTRTDNGIVVNVTGNHNITISDLNIQQEYNKGKGSPLYLNGTVNLTIEGNNKIKGQADSIYEQGIPAIFLLTNRKLVITAESTGTLTVESGDNAPAIGGTSRDYNGTVIINGGTIYATCGSGAAAIGGGSYWESDGGSITINGGAVSAKAGSYGVSFGAGDGNDKAQITIGKTAHVYMPKGYRGTLTINGEQSGDYVKGTYHDAYVAAGFPCTLCKKAADKKEAVLTLNPKEMDYNGQPQRPEAALALTAKFGDDSYSYNFIEGTDYVLRCEMEQDGQYVSIGTPTDAGTYYLAAYSGETLIVRENFDIKKVDSGVTAAPTANTLTYTGEPQALVSAGKADGGTLVYSLDGVNFSAEIPTGTDAGKYTVYYKVVGDKNHNDTSVQPVSVSIAKAQPELPKALSGVYGAKLSTVDLPEGWTWDAKGAVIEGAANSASYTGDKNHVPASGVTLMVAVVRSQTEMTAKTDKADYTYGEYVVVTVTPKATGESAKKRMARFDAPQPGEVSLWNGETQITKGVPAANGSNVTFDLSTVADGLIPGSHTLTAKYTASDNMDEQTAEVSFTVAYAETEKEAAESGKQLENGIYAEQPTLTAPEGTKISLSNGPDAQWSDELLLPTEDGEHTYTYYMKLKDGTIAEKTVTLTVDTTPPEVMEPTVLVDPTKATIIVPATDAVSGVMDIQIKVNSGEGDLTIEGNGDGSYTVSGLIPGETYSFTLTVRDYVGHETKVDITITAPLPPALPQTGDHSRMALWLMMLAMAGAGVMLLRRKAEQ